MRHAESAASSPAASGRGQHRPLGPVADDTRLAVEIRGLVERGDMDAARERFERLVAAHQRRALRIAYQYLRDSAEADEAVQDAFIKVYSHIASYREAWPFEVWFTRILINGCLDRRKARARRVRLTPSMRSVSPSTPPAGCPIRLPASIVWDQRRNPMSSLPERMPESYGDALARLARAERLDVDDMKLMILLETAGEPLYAKLADGAMAQASDEAL